MSYHAEVAKRLAEIADRYACIIQASDYRLPDDIRKLIETARDRFEEALPRTGRGRYAYFDEDAMRRDLAKEYIDTELEMLANIARGHGVGLDIEVMRELIVPLSYGSRWDESY